MSLSWYPIINYALCSSCGVCFEFCPHGVYGLNQEDGPAVVQPEHCIHGCHGCENQCPSHAIRYYGDLPRFRPGKNYRLD